MTPTTPPRAVIPERTSAQAPARLSAPARDTSTVAQRARLRWRRWRWWLLVLAAVVLVALVTALIVPRTSQGDLDPESAAPDGTRAVAQILQRQGVRLIRVTGSAEVAHQSWTAGTLVVVHPQLLGPQQLDRIEATDNDLVLVEPDAAVLRRLARFATVAGTVPARQAAPDCADPAATAAGTARAGGHLYRVDAARPPGTSACYPQPGESGVAGLVRWQIGDRTVTVLGQADVLRNGHLAEQGNAALALRVLGHRDRLIWYLPDPLELSAAQQQPSVGELTPTWVPWAALQLVVTVLLAMLWRARRLGRLVTEPLPIVVRAAETQEGRARLYRQAGARDRAAATLRTATARRLATRLDIPPDAAPATLATLAADVTVRPTEQVHQLLLGSAPRDDAALVRLADELDRLERDVASTRVAGRSINGRTSGASGTAPGSSGTAQGPGQPGTGDHPSDQPHRTDQPDREAPQR